MITLYSIPSAMHQLQQAVRGLFYLKVYVLLEYFKEFCVGCLVRLLYHLGD